MADPARPSIRGFAPSAAAEGRTGKSIAPGVASGYASDAAALMRTDGRRSATRYLAGVERLFVVAPRTRSPLRRRPVRLEGPSLKAPSSVQSRSIAAPATSASAGGLGPLSLLSSAGTGSRANGGSSSKSAGAATNLPPCPLPPPAAAPPAATISTVPARASTVGRPTPLQPLKPLKPWSAEKLRELVPSPDPEVALPASSNRPARRLVALSARELPPLAGPPSASAAFPSQLPRSAPRARPEPHVLLAPFSTTKGRHARAMAAAGLQPPPPYARGGSATSCVADASLSHSERRITTTATRTLSGNPISGISGSTNSHATGRGKRPSGQPLTSDVRTAPHREATARSRRVSFITDETSDSQDDLPAAAPPPAPRGPRGPQSETQTASSRDREIYSVLPLPTRMLRRPPHTELIL
jgi:hypothetical protein